MAQPTRPYYSSKGVSAVHYDLLPAADKKLSGDLEVYAGLANGPSQILELGAGTGRIAVDLAQRGHSVFRPRHRTRHARSGRGQAKGAGP